MVSFANAAEFSGPSSRLLAMGANLDRRQAIVDPLGNVLAFKETGGILNPSRYELWPNAEIFRFGSSGRSPYAVAQGLWWIEKKEFEKLLSFAQSHELSVAMAMRLLCLVPPEWSDASLLIRARVSRALLAWRGLGNSVVIPAPASAGTIALPHRNEIAARRLNQLCIPGLNRPFGASSAVAIENAYELNAKEGVRGYLYL